jgi:arginine utilization protein RocB
MARDLTLEMTRHASVSNSEGERSFAPMLHGMIAREAYFQTHPDHVRVEAIANDPFERSNVLALVRGTGSRTVVLTGHFDVVSTANYGPLEPWAFEPEILREKLIADLRQSARSQSELLALHDLESGEFLPGRGLLDMKSGLAAGLVALYRLAKLEERFGSLIFLAVADEEVQSHGARGAISQLEAFVREHDLEIDCVINLDATGDNEDGSEGQAVYFGSVGKLLVSAYVAGIDTHAGYPLTGINPNFLLSEIVTRIECNPALADHAHGESAPPPTVLKQLDLKTHYDVTTPARAWACWNVLTHGKPAAKVLEEFRDQTQTALDQSLETLRGRARAWGAPSDLWPAALEVQAFVMTFAELIHKARERHPAFDTRLEQFIASLDSRLDAPTISMRITDFVWAQSELIGPAVVLGFGSLHYPAVLLEDEPTIQTIRASLETAQLELGIQVRERQFFAGISDMSWFGIANTHDLEMVNTNTPAPRARIQNPTRAATLGVPTINIGPWGRDYHQWLERAHIKYSFEHLPEIVWRVAMAVLGKSS